MIPIVSKPAAGGDGPPCDPRRSPAGQTRRRVGVSSRAPSRCCRVPASNSAMSPSGIWRVSPARAPSSVATPASRPPAHPWTRRTPTAPRCRRGPRGPDVDDAPRHSRAPGVDVRQRACTSATGPRRLTLYTLSGTSGVVSARGKLGAMAVLLTTISSSNLPGLSTYVSLLPRQFERDPTPIPLEAPVTKAVPPPLGERSSCSGGWWSPSPYVSRFPPQLHCLLLSRQSCGYLGRDADIRIGQWQIEVISNVSPELTTSHVCSNRHAGLDLPPPSPAR